MSMPIDLREFTKIGINLPSNVTAKGDSKTKKCTITFPNPSNNPREFYSNFSILFGQMNAAGLTKDGTHHYEDEAQTKFVITFTDADGIICPKIESKIEKKEDEIKTPNPDESTLAYCATILSKNLTLKNLSFIEIERLFQSLESIYVYSEDLKIVIIANKLLESFAELFDSYLNEVIQRHIEPSRSIIKSFDEGLISTNDRTNFIRYRLEEIIKIKQTCIDYSTKLRNPKNKPDLREIENFIKRLEIEKKNYLIFQAAMESYDSQQISSSIEYFNQMLQMESTKQVNEPSSSTIQIDTQLINLYIEKLNEKLQGLESAVKKTLETSHTSDPK